MEKAKISVLLDNKHVHRIHDVAKEAKSAGMDVDQILETSGVFTGSVDRARLKHLRTIKGIANVEEDRPAQIAPPESELQ
jgi:hypothetical protein